MRIMFAIDCKFEHGELYRRFVANKQIMKQRYRMHTEYVKVRQIGLSLFLGSKICPNDPNKVISTQQSRIPKVLSELWKRFFMWAFYEDINLKYFKCSIIKFLFELWWHELWYENFITSYFRLEFSLEESLFKQLLNY